MAREECRGLPGGQDRPADAPAHAGARAREAREDPALIAADASVAVAAFAPWHEHQHAAQTALGPRPSIVAHAAFETYSVLTRLPGGQRAPAALVREQLEDRFGDRWLGLSAHALRLALARLEELGVAGGATYDGLIGMTAAASDAMLVTLDERALQTYALVGADVAFVGA